MHLLECIMISIILTHTILVYENFAIKILDCCMDNDYQNSLKYSLSLVLNTNTDY